MEIIISLIIVAAIGVWLFQDYFKSLINPKPEVSLAPYKVEVAPEPSPAVEVKAVAPVVSTPEPKTRKPRAPKVEKVVKEKAKPAKGKAPLSKKPRGPRSKKV